MMTPTQAAAYFCSFHKLATSRSRDEMLDVYGFLVSDTAPLDAAHSYHSFITLEDTYAFELGEMRKEFGSGTPSIKNLVCEHLGISRTVDERFYDLLTLSREE